MDTLSKLSVAGLFGVLVAFAPSSGAVAGPVGVGASAVTPVATPIETVRLMTYRHWHPGYWHMHGAAYAPSTAYVYPTARPADTARGLAFVAAGLFGPAAFLVVPPWQ